MKVKLIIISIILLLVMVFACGCIPFMEKIGLINPTNEEQLSPEKTSSDGLVKVLIGFKEKPGLSQQAMVKGVGGQIKYTYHIVDAIAASIPQKAIDALRKNPNITHVELDIKVYALDAELDNSWGVKHIGAGVVHGNGNKGTGVNIAIIDSGIDYTHPDLDANYAGGYDFVNDDDDPMDDDGHGTHVAGTVAAEDDGEGVVGVAPEASLYALKVLGPDGSGSYSDVIAAIDWCVAEGIQVTNNSYGSSGDPGETVKVAFDNSALAGVLHVAAAGNSGNPPGRGDNVIYPARYVSVIAVAATDQSDKRARWSSTGPDLELSAPGVAINSTLLGGGHGEKSGTSMASPHVAGVAALVIAGEGLSNVEVRTRLQETADDLGDAGWDSKYGYGLVDADEAAPPQTVTDDTTPPSKVTGLTVTTFSCVQLDLTWDANTEEDLYNYNVYRSTTNGTSDPYDLVASPTMNSYSDVGLTISTTYYYVVTAVDNSGNEGEESDKASGATSTDNLGPLTSDVVAEPNPTNGAASVTLTANISDVSTCNSNIVAAEYFVGVGGSVTSMSVSDGAFDSPTEEVTASIGISGWDVGQYTLYVRGKDAAGNWGATESVVLDVTGAPSDTMHVSDINMSFKTPGINVNAIAAVTIVDATTKPVGGATVYGTWSGETNDTDSGVTDVDGQVSLQSDKVKNPDSGTTFNFTVDNVTKDGWTYDSLPEDEKPKESITFNG